jgi:hypothetical protein
LQEFVLDPEGSVSLAGLFHKTYPCSNPIVDKVAARAD